MPLREICLNSTYLTRLSLAACILLCCYRVPPPLLKARQLCGPYPQCHYVNHLISVCPTIWLFYLSLMFPSRPSRRAFVENLPSNAHIFAILGMFRVLLCCLRQLINVQALWSVPPQNEPLISENCWWFKSQKDDKITKTWVSPVFSPVTFGGRHLPGFQEEEDWWCLITKWMHLFCTVPWHCYSSLNKYTACKAYDHWGVPVGLRNFIEGSVWKFEKETPCNFVRLSQQGFETFYF